MSITAAELAALPTAPTVSDILNRAAQHAGDGPIPALTRAAYGSTNPADYAALVTPEHTLAWCLAIVTAARVANPAAMSAWDGTESAGDAADRVGTAHQLLTEWVDGRPAAWLAELFRAAADRIRKEEA